MKLRPLCTRSLARSLPSQRGPLPAQAPGKVGLGMGRGPGCLRGSPPNAAGPGIDWHLRDGFELPAQRWGFWSCSSGLTPTPPFYLSFSWVGGPWALSQNWKKEEGALSKETSDPRPKPS